MKVLWTKRAVEHLSSIYEYIAEDSPLYAKSVVDRLTKRSEQIGTFPMSGRKVPEYEAENIREIIESPYRIIYRIKSTEIHVLAVIHSTQILPHELS